MQSKNAPHSQGEYDVYSTFQSHEPEFDYLKSLEIEEKINKIKWLPQQNAAHSLLSTNGEQIHTLPSRSLAAGSRCLGVWLESSGLPTRSSLVLISTPLAWHCGCSTPLPPLATHANGRQH